MPFPRSRSCRPAFSSAIRRNFSAFTATRCSPWRPSQTLPTGPWPAGSRRAGSWPSSPRTSTACTKRPGSKRVFELHGSIWRNHCTRCGKSYGAGVQSAAVRASPPASAAGRSSPTVVLYEEALDEQCLAGAVGALEQADLLIVGGTSLTVYPAAGLLGYYRGAEAGAHQPRTRRPLTGARIWSCASPSDRCSGHCRPKRMKV